LETPKNNKLPSLTVNTQPTHLLPKKTDHNFKIKTETVDHMILVVAWLGSDTLQSEIYLTICHFYK
jgi:hypothetical protein